MSLYARSPLRTCLRLSSGAAAARRTTAVPLPSIRHASLTSAIGRGIRKSQFLESPSTRDRRSDRPRAENEEGRGWNRKDAEWTDDAEYDEDEFIRTGKFRALPRQLQVTRPSSLREDNSTRASDEEHKGPRIRKHRVRSPEEKNEYLSGTPENKEIKKKKKKNKNKEDATERFSDSRPERVKINVKVPASIPYTTPASEFIYGTTAVEASLRCSRRQLYKLYIYQSPGEELSPTKISLRKLALSRSVPVKLAFGLWDSLMDKMSAGRPHNGLILEASPLPRLPVTSFEAVTSPETDHFRVTLGAQSREEAAVNGTDNRIPKISPIQSLSSQQQNQHYYPLTLLLDGIVDPGNLGAILRSAYYLGVSAVCFTGRNSAPLSPVTIKASAGAAENMTLLKVNNAVDFIKQSRQNGWRFYAADAPGPGTATASNVIADGSGAGNLLREAPAVLMLGSEGTGLSPHVKSHADSFVGIPGVRLGLEGDLMADPARVDSLNVSVAAALLMEMFMRVPLVVSEAQKNGPGGK